MIIPIGKAAIIETDCKPYMEFSAKRSPIGRSMKIIAHKVRIALWGSSLAPIRLYEYIDAISVSVSNDVA